MDQRLLSVIIPVHNGEPYLRELIQKIKQNPYENIEILIGDDASTDNTAEILKEYSQDSKIKVFSSSKNIGAGAIRNQLLNLASGQFIAMQDVDDLFDDSRFLKQVSFLERHPEIDVLGTGACLIDQGENWGTLPVTSSPSAWNWFQQNSMVHASIMFRNHVLSYNIRYAENMRFGEDYYFLTGLYLAQVKFYNLNEQIYFYHISKGELKSRIKRYYFELLKSKIRISGLYPISVRYLFICFHAIKLTVGNVLSRLKII